MKDPIRLTLRQHAAIEKYTPHLFEVFCHDITNGPVNTVEVVAPFAAWDHLVSVLAVRFATRGALPPGHHVRTLRSLLRRPADAMARVWMHPALQGRVKAGQHFPDGSIPAWRQDEDRFGRVWSPRVTDGPFQLLAPRIIHVGSRPCTTWDHLGIVVDHWTYDRELHEAISSRGSLPRLREAGCRQR